MIRSLLGLTLCIALAVVCSACINRSIRVPVFDEEGTEVYLRAKKSGLGVVERGFDHPAQISPVRMAHILSRVDLRTPESKRFLRSTKPSERIPAIPLKSLYVIADGLSKALAAADPNQEVIVRSVLKEKRLALFDHSYLTSFISYVQDDQLFIHLSRFDWEVPKSGREHKLPEPDVSREVMKFRLIPSEAMTLMAPQALAVDWRDSIFRKPTRTRVTPGGEVVRKTILMEMQDDPDDVVDPLSAGIPANASPQTLRDLADLEEVRRKGLITESQYRKRKQQILDAERDAP